MSLRLQSPDSRQARAGLRQPTTRIVAVAAVRVVVVDADSWTVLSCQF
jgi:hypothetical protein